MSRIHAGRGLPWDALSGDLHPSVHVTLLRSEHGPVFYAGVAGALLVLMQLMLPCSTCHNAEFEQFGAVLT